jgi:hypothetical protein
MLYALRLRRLALALSLGLLSTTAHAGGYNGGSNNYSAIAPQEAQAILSYADYYSDGDFHVSHTESAGATAQTDANGETAYGFGSSETNIESGSGVISLKRSVQRSSGYAANGSASASGSTATLLKVRTSDGRWYVFRGYASAGASAGPNGTATSQGGFARSAGGRY